MNYHFDPGLLGNNCRGWIGGFQDSCFKVVTTKASWSQAKGICRDIGGDLAQLDTHATNAFIVGNLALATSKVHPVDKACYLHYSY